VKTATGKGLAGLDPGAIDGIEVNPLRRCGVPVVAGTRFPMARLLAELAEGRSVRRLAADFDLDAAALARALHGLAVALDRPMARRPRAGDG
jgi:uncharacterized protein (DUF433 family)